MRSSIPSLVLLLVLPACIFVTEAEQLAHTDADGDGVPASEDCADDDVALGAPLPEVCNGLDDDCDGSIDEGLHPDEDGDGVGASSPSSPCFVGWVESLGDCDDDDPQTWPGAPEVCDGRSNDCLADWAPADDAGLVTWRRPDGLVEDWTERFRAGAPGEAADVALPSSGVLAICGSAEPYAVRLRGEGVEDLEVRGVPLGDEGPLAERPTLHGLRSDGDGATVEVVGEDWRLVLRALRIAGGVATPEEPGGGLRLVGGVATLRNVVVSSNLAVNGTEGGAGVYAEGMERLAVVDSEIVGNTGEGGTDGGGLLARGVDLRLDAVRFVENTVRGFGGAVALQSGELHAFDSVFTDNEGADGGGALFLGEGAEGFVHESDFAANLAGQGGGAWIEGALSCFDLRGGSTWSANEAQVRGAVWAVIGPGAASFDGCLASEGIVTTLMYPAAQARPDIYCGASGAASLGEYYSMTGDWLFCTSAFCNGDVE